MRTTRIRLIAFPQQVFTLRLRDVRHCSSRNKMGTVIYSLLADGAKIKISTIFSPIYENIF